MKITFLGTGTSMGVPVAGGFGSDRLGPDPRNRRSRCSVYIESQDTKILIDAGPEFREQSLRCGVRWVDALLITHEHMDHVSGIDDLRPFTIASNRPIPLYSHPRVLASIRKRFDYMFGPGRYPGSTSLELIPATSSFMVGALRVTPLPIHHGDLLIHGYRVNDVAYLTDVLEIPSSTMALLDGVRLLVMGALRWHVPHPSHMTVEHAIEISERIGADRVRLIHMNGSVRHGDGVRLLPDHMLFAYDQEVLWV